jgi:hypothetical protein
MGTFAPHLSHIADIPHFTPITPVRREVGPMTPARASMIRPPPPSAASSSSEWETMGSAEKRREGGRRERRGPPPAERERPRRRASRPLEAAAMVAPGDGRRGAGRQDGWSGVYAAARRDGWVLPRWAVGFSELGAREEMAQWGEASTRAGSFASGPERSWGFRFPDFFLISSAFPICDNQNDAILKHLSKKN